MPDVILRCFTRPARDLLAIPRISLPPVRPSSVAPASCRSGWTPWRARPRRPPSRRRPCRRRRRRRLSRPARAATPRPLSPAASLVASCSPSVGLERPRPSRRAPSASAFSVLVRACCVKGHAVGDRALTAVCTTSGGRGVAAARIAPQAVVLPARLLANVEVRAIAGTVHARAHTARSNVIAVL